MKKEGIIIGAGMAGLTAAIAMQKLGTSIKIYEWAPVLEAVGAGIWMAPNAMQVFERLGIAHKINEGGVPLEKIQIVDSNMHPILRTDQDAFRDRFGFTTTAIRRSSLQEILLQEIPKENLVLGKKCTGIKNIDGKSIALFEDGSSTTADFIIAADGVHSSIRNQVFPKAILQNKNTCCWRGIAMIQLRPDFKKAIIESWDQGVRFGFSEVKDGMVDWFAVQRTKDKNPWLIKKRLIELFGSFAYPVIDILTATDEAQIIRNDISDMDPLSVWHKGNVCLIGDAAHASTPYMGQGGCQGVEDAYTIAQCLHKHNSTENAFAAFEKARKSKAHFIVRTSRKMGHIGYLSGTMGRARNMFIRALPLSFTQSQFNKVYTLKY
jgi:2-polyprenyl-6-methoxyphenol hydroxylase-like FAD-dependent oxidoreductase